MNPVVENGIAIYPVVEVDMGIGLLVRITRGVNFHYWVYLRDSNE